MPFQHTFDLDNGVLVAELTGTSGHVITVNAPMTVQWLHYATARIPEIEPFRSGLVWFFNEAARGRISAREAYRSLQSVCKHLILEVLPCSHDDSRQLLRIRVNNQPGQYDLEATQAGTKRVIN